MDDIFLLSHKDSNNRGCEAITLGTARILGDKRRLIAFSTDVETDLRMGMDKTVHLLAMPVQASSWFWKIYAKLMLKMGKKEYVYAHRYKSCLDQIAIDDLELSTGGDMLCYDNNEVIYLNDYLWKKGVRTVLWGCSIGEENLTLEKVRTLKRFSLIVARESLTEQMLKNRLRLENVQLFPDPAFVLPPEPIDLPSYFEQECIGINLSNFAGLLDVRFDTLFGKNIVALLEYILVHTELTIVLLPHVFWEGQDDRIICQDVYKRYKASGRVHVVDLWELNYCKIRYIISKCRLFIGARTHSMISAYCACVPALALGYSVKSKGIAKDIGLPEELVVDYRSLRDKNDLVNAFVFLKEHEGQIRSYLTDRMPQYCQLAYGAKIALESVLNRNGCEGNDRNKGQS